MSPPVGAALVFGPTAAARTGGGPALGTTMCVGGPNARSDYHVEAGEELFLQLPLPGGSAGADAASAAPLVLRLVERGRARDVAVRPGEIFLLPARVPHSPQRAVGSLGLVWERARLAGEADALRWYVRAPAAGDELANPADVLYAEWFACRDLGADLAPVIARFRTSAAAATGVPDANAAAPPAPPLRPLADDVETAVAPPRSLCAWVDEVARGPTGGAVLMGPGAADAAFSGADFRVEVLTARTGHGWAGPAWNPPPGGARELFLYQIAGSAIVHLRRRADGTETALPLLAEAMLVVGRDCDIRLELDEGSAAAGSSGSVGGGGGGGGGGGVATLLVPNANG